MEGVVTDSLKIHGRIMQGIVSRILETKIEKTLGYKLKINVKDFDAAIVDDKVNMHLTIAADIPIYEFQKLTENI